MNSAFSPLQNQVLGILELAPLRMRLSAQMESPASILRIVDGNGAPASDTPLLAALLDALRSLGLLQGTVRSPDAIEVMLATETPAISATIDLAELRRSAAAKRALWQQFCQWQPMATHPQ